MTPIYSYGKVRIRKSIWEDVLVLKDVVRESDRLEIMASHRHTPYQALRYGFVHSSVCLTVLFDETPVCMFGIVPDAQSQEVAAIWLLASRGIYRMRYTFLRMSRRYVEFLLQERRILCNFVDARNMATARWLEWCGATLADPQPYGTDQMPFRFFFFEKQEACLV